jgi:hypothetical protein
MTVQNPPVKGGFEPPVMSFSGVVSIQHRVRRGHQRLLKWKTDAAAYRGRQDATRRHLLFAMADPRCFEMESKDPPVLLPTMWIVPFELPVAEDLEHIAQSG